MAPPLRGGHRKYYVPFYRTIKQQAQRYNEHCPVMGSLGEGAAQILPVFRRKFIHIYLIERYVYTRSGRGVQSSALSSGLFVLSSSFDDLRGSHSGNNWHSGSTL